MRFILDLIWSDIPIFLCINWNNLLLSLFVSDSPFKVLSRCLKMLISSSIDISIWFIFLFFSGSKSLVRINPRLTNLHYKGYGHREWWLLSRTAPSRLGFDSNRRGVFAPSRFYPAFCWKSGFGWRWFTRFRSSFLRLSLSRASKNNLFKGAALFLLGPVFYWFSECIITRLLLSAPNRSFGMQTATI